MPSHLLPQLLDGRLSRADFAIAAAFEIALQVHP